VKWEGVFAEGELILFLFCTLLIPHMLFKLKEEAF